MENPRHLSGSRIRPGTVIERSQIKFVIFKMQEDVNGVLARMINTSACKQPSNVSTLRCKMNRCKAPLIANIPRAGAPSCPTAAVTTAVPRCPRWDKLGSCQLGESTPRGEPARPQQGLAWGWGTCKSSTGTPPSWDGERQGTSPRAHCPVRNAVVCTHRVIAMYLYL